MKKRFERLLMPVIYGILVSAMLLLPGQLSARPAQAQDATMECWAVIIGISDYQNFANLNFADDDARDLAAQLSPIWGSDHVKLLTDSQATKANIEDAMTNWLPSRENTNDVVFFYHSGYLESGYLYTYNSLTSSYNNDLSANELDGWLAGLDSEKVVVMGVGGGTLYNVLSRDGRVILAQSTGGEGSFEIYDLGHEAFTYYVLEALSNFKAASNKSNYELSVEEIFAYAKTKTTDYISAQHPQMSDRCPGDVNLLTKVTADADISATQASNVLTIDGKAYSLSSLPVSLIGVPGSSHDIEATTPVSGTSGTRYVFDSWDDGTKSTSKTITSGGIYTAEYKTQYYLTVNSAYGQPAGQDWYDSGSTATISVVTPVEQAGTKRIFTGWDGDYSGDAASGSVVMNEAKTVTASWKTQYYLTVNSVYGDPEGAGWYDSGSIVSISIDELVEEAGTKHHFTQWSGDYAGNAASASLVMNSPKTVDAEWSTDYLLTVVSEYGDSQGGGWYNAGSTAAISVTSPVGMIVRKVFNGWTGDYTGDTASVSVTVNSPMTVTASWKSDLMQLYILIIVIVVILGGLAFWLLKIRKPKAPIVSSETAPPPPSPKRCANCGAEVEPGDAFCIKCGKSVKDN